MQIYVVAPRQDSMSLARANAVLSDLMAPHIHVCVNRIVCAHTHIPAQYAPLAHVCCSKNIQQFHIQDTHTYVHVKHALVLLLFVAMHYILDSLMTSPISITTSMYSIVTGA